MHNAKMLYSAHINYSQQKILLNDKSLVGIDVGLGRIRSPATVIGRRLKPLDGRTDPKLD
jgi:hypothetical protein